MSILALPDELLEHIVLYADRADLRACALAYSSLRVPSQRLLFRELALKSKESAMRIGTVLRAAPALAAAVRVLVLHGVPGTLCAALGVTLPALHTLRLYGCRSFTADAFVPCALKAIRRLVIANSDFADMGEIANLLCALPNVSALEFADYSIVLAPDAPVLSPAPTPTLALMSLDPRGLVRTQVLNSLSRWLCAPGSRVLARLETLCTNALMYAPSTLTVAPKLLLDAVAPTLKELRVLQHLEEVGKWPCAWQILC
jgi:hypothetical protein